MTRVTTRPFGHLSDGTPVTCWILENEHRLRTEVLDYGATIRSLQVPDRTGTLVDVVLGYDDLEGYTGNGSYYGATIGRFGNRIGGASFSLNGRTYHLANNNGDHHLHGGTAGFDKRMWHGQETDNGVVFSRLSPDGEEGYPGNLVVSVAFGWEGSGFFLKYRAMSDQDTIINLTNHSYFNLNGSGSVEKQLLMIHADTYTVNDPSCLPTGEIAPVAGTAMDFRTLKPIGRDADNNESCVRSSCGYDANYVLLPDGPAAVAKSPESGIVMTMTTDQPGVQLFTANHMKERLGKGGLMYGHRWAFCLETQHFPDCIHHPEWPSCILRAGDVFESKTTYAFDVE